MDTSRLTSRRSQRAQSAPTAVQPGSNGTNHRPAAPSDVSVAKLDRWLIERLLGSLGGAPLAVELWNGERIVVQGTSPDIAVRIADRRTLWKLIRDPFFQFGEAYSDGRLQIEGIELVDFLRVFDDAISGEKDGDGTRRNWWPFGKKKHRNTLAGSRKNIHHHYDLGNEFYRLWLDEQLLYTCAYFEQPGVSLEDAQRAKMDHVCRKVWLRPGDEVVEAGCGWGAFALHAAKHYGVKVRAYNISKQQIAYARERARREGLADRVEFVEDDWRSIDGSFDAFVSIGMLEHVGTENYPELGRIVRRCLNENGRGLIHSIGQNQPRPFDRWIEERIFPGAYPPTLAEMTSIFENNALSILDLENIRLHYAETIAHWLQRFEASAGKIAGLFDDRFVRMWRLYLAGSFAAFEADRLQLYQAVFSPEKHNHIPRNRRHQYDVGKAPLRFDPEIEIGPAAE